MSTDIEHNADTERTYHTLRIDPGNVELQCLRCYVHIFGVTAKDALDSFRSHLLTHIDGNV